jgi:hypothetical protein
MLVERKKNETKRKKLPAQTTSDIVWARLLYEVAVAVVARSIGGVWMGLTGWWWR